jgi:hypothetical protein
MAGGPAATATPGVYQGGRYTREEWRSAPYPPLRLSSEPTRHTGGTVYGGDMGLPTSSNVEAPIEMSGSLTGLILSRGSSTHVQPKERRSRARKVALILAGVLAFVVVIGLVVATMAGDFITAILDGLTGN